MILDTSFLIDILRRDRAALARAKSLEAQGEVLWIPSPAVFELWDGFERADRPDLEAKKVEAIMRDYTILDLGKDAAAHAGRLSGSLGRRGTPVDPVDVQIAGMAMELGKPILTRNVKDFEKIPGTEVVTY